MKQSLCILKGCGRHEHSRGLCFSHYQAARRLIKKGKTTWPYLEMFEKARQSSRAPYGKAIVELLK